MTSCPDIRDLLDDALDQRLAPASQSAFDEHVRSCAACAAEWEFATSLRKSLLRIGLDPAPAGLRESIAADVRRMGRSRPRAQAYARAAAAVLVVVTVAWLGLRSRQTGMVPASNEAAGTERADAADDRSKTITKAKLQDRAAVPRQISTGPAGHSWQVEPMAPMAEALSNAREIVEAGLRSSGTLSRILDAGATPEHRLRQAAFLVMLHDNVGAVADLAGEGPGLTQLARDADDTFGVFSNSNRGAAAKLSSDADEMKAPGEKAPNDAAKDSARKVVQAPMPPAASSRLEPEAAREPSPDEPAFYLVSGPGAIGRVERVLAGRGLRSQPVLLADKAENPKKRKLEEQATAYRIVEVQVPEAGVNDLVGDLESLTGLQLSPVGRGTDVTSRLGGAAAGAPSEQRKPLSNRKLRLVLIDR